MASGGSQNAKRKERDKSAHFEGDHRSQDRKKMSKFEEEGGFKFVVKFIDKNDKGLNPLKLLKEIKNKMGFWIHSKRKSVVKRDYPRFL